MENILPWVQLGLSVLLIITILLQHSGSGLDGALGGGGTDVGVVHTRRGFERTLFYLSIVLGILFSASALIALF